jgi:8-oxo-dGTP pyrophosphatase MutT (NUDIX family)
MPTATALNLNKLRQLLTPAAAINLNSELRQAAVLVLICNSAEGSFIPLTKRSVHLPIHAGQISFPGGRVQAGDLNLATTAMRETMEEIGVNPQQITATSVSSGYEITPVVAITETKLQFNPEPGEVAEMISFPLLLALDRQRYMLDANPENPSKSVMSIEYKEFYIWGATARILHSLACMVAATNNSCE